MPPVCDITSAQVFFSNLVAIRKLLEAFDAQYHLSSENDANDNHIVCLRQSMCLKRVILEIDHHDVARSIARNFWWFMHIFIGNFHHDFSMFKHHLYKRGSIPTISLKLLIIFSSFSKTFINHSSYLMSPSAANSSSNNNRKRSSSRSNSPNKRTKIEDVEHDATKAMASNEGNVLIWFRSDLRTNDNPALAQALELATSRRNGRSESKSASAIAIFIMSPKEFKSHDVGAVKLDFILRNLKEISTTLWDKHRIPLLVKTSSSAANVISDFKQLCITHNVSDVFANQEFEVDETRRDNKLSTVLSDENINFHLLQDQCVVKPGELKSKSSNSVYTVYSPFKRRWFEVVKGSKDKYLTEAKALSNFKAPFNTEANLKAIGISKPDEVPLVLEGFELDEEKRKRLSELWPAGEHNGLENLNKFCSSKTKPGAAAVNKYQTDRNFPNLEQGTSKLSPYLAVGALTTKQCIVKAVDANGGKLDYGNSGN